MRTMNPRITYSLPSYEPRKMFGHSTGRARIHEGIYLAFSVPGNSIQTDHIGEYRTLIHAIKSSLNQVHPRTSVCRTNAWSGSHNLIILYQRTLVAGIGQGLFITKYFY